MPAEWEMIGYRVDREKLYGVIGSNDDTLRTAVLEAARTDDHRLQASVDAIVDELLTGKLVKDHARSYRIFTEAFLEAGAKRLVFDLDRTNKGMPSLMTYAPRLELGDTLSALGHETLGKGWDRELGWPWQKAQPAWPSIAYWSPDEVANAEQELAKAGKRTAFDVVDDEYHAEDMDHAVRALCAMVKVARAKLGAKRPPLAGDWLVVFRDGEQ